MQRRDLAEAVANAEGRIRALVSACLEEDPGREIDHIYFRLGDPFNAFNITGCAYLCKAPTFASDAGAEMSA